MKKSILLILFGVFFISNIYSQSSSDKNREANPEQQYVQDNSERAQLWNRMIQAKFDGNEELHAQLNKEYFAKYPDLNQAPINNDAPFAQGPETPQPPFQGDWGSGDIRVAAGDILFQSGSNNFQAGYELEVDSLGNKYVGYITRDRDSLVVYKSTDQGLTWVRINRINPGGTNKWHSFDMFITDSANVFRIGIAASRTPTSSSWIGELYWMSMRDDGSGFRAQVVLATPPNFGFVNPSITSDGWDYSAGSTYWYIAYQRVDAAGLGSQCLAAMTTNWGYAFQHDTVRNTFNDFHLDIEYNAVGTDSIYVVFTNDITASDPNLRIMRISLGNFGSATGWTQFNVATALPDFDGELAVNRNDGTMGLVYTVGNSNLDVVARYTDGSTYWGTVVNVSATAGNESRARIDNVERQGAFRIIFVSAGTKDTVIYTSGFTIPALSGRTIVNASTTSNASTSTSPDIAGFRTGPGAFGAGAIFSLVGPTDIYYDGSNITPTGINQNGNEIPASFNLSQNYPNPFNPTTNINFAIPVNGFVKLVVFDMLGREVATIINNEMTAGSYVADFNAASLASGIYFYKLTSGDFTSTKKMILVK
ncbi:MAG: T9SS type A sorting domain-containing protein [Ignavibacteria bacterium]|nr:T9SS type A sorting domain-containing protein [Ignavibacteria bacterium]